MSTKGQKQEQGHQKQEQKQELPPDPVREQQEAYTQPEQAIASDPITEAPKVEEPKTEKPAPAPKPEQKPHGH